ncbi:hypothetical protein JHK82_027738 [Glycine max]|nr:hypothetical protein JHK87_027646 [Glycine soja]KAG4996952.1 hypothetical protein JHK85_028391 [Glycine max]KAG5126903.1 hypothetical protein JHK82_027738 [Glycine max]
MKPAPTAGRISMTIRNLPKYIEIEVANDILRAQTMELVNRLRFMNSILEITNAVGGGGVAPLLAALQPTMAAALKFMMEP